MITNAAVYRRNTFVFSKGHRLIRYGDIAEFEQNDIGKRRVVLLLTNRAVTEKADNRLSVGRELVTAAGALARLIHDGEWSPAVLRGAVFTADGSNLRK